MGYGLVALAEVQTTDLVSPGLPAFSALNQVSNTVVNCTVTLPTLDANGDNLSGLTKLTVVTLPKTGATSPFEGLSMNQCIVLSGAVKVDVVVTMSDAGVQKSVDIPVVNLGGFQSFAAACAD